MMEAVTEFVNNDQLHHMMDPILFATIAFLAYRKSHYKKLYKQSQETK